VWVKAAHWRYSAYALQHKRNITNNTGAFVVPLSHRTHIVAIVGDNARNPMPKAALALCKFPPVSSLLCNVLGNLQS
jgi:hypothetical protein